MLRSSKYVGMVLCICKEQFPGLVSSIPVFFLIVIGKRFEDLGLADIVLETGTMAQVSRPRTVKGRHYNRSVRVVALWG